MFDEYIPLELLEEVIHKQHKTIEYQKKNDHSKLHSILIIADDFEAGKEALRQGAQNAVMSLI